MKITSKILHFPPYLSTSWSQVRALYLKDLNLMVCLMDGTVIAIPGLSNQMIETIFAAHASFLEGNYPRQNAQAERPLFQIMSNISPQASDSDGQSLRFGFDNMESLGSAMQHNPAQANMPDLPKEIVNKIAAIAKAIAPEDIQNVPKPEPHCNCMHCQISKAIHQYDEGEKESSHKQENSENVKEEDIKDEDLSFQQWEIVQTGDKLYSVINKLDNDEKYSVFLGQPVGCTCGKQGCEHVLAVLKS